MSLDFDYGINVVNRFSDLLDHDEDPDEFIAKQISTHEKEKKTAAEAKTTSTKSNKKSAKTETKLSNDTTKENKENVTEKQMYNDQRKRKTTVLSDKNNEQKSRAENSRSGSARGQFSKPDDGFHDRPPYRDGRGGRRGQLRSPRSNRNEEQYLSNEPSGFEQSNNLWTNETTNETQSFRGFRRGGRGGPRRGGDFERGRGRGGRGRGRGGPGQFHNRNFDTNSQQPTQEFGDWQESANSNFETQSFSTPQTGDQELNHELSQQEQTNESTDFRRGGRGRFRSRTFRSRNYGGNGGSEHFHQNDNENQFGGVRHENYGFRRRPYGRPPRSHPFAEKSVERRNDEQIFNFENQTENFEQRDFDVSKNDEKTSSAPKDWAQQVDEAEKQMTLDEYKQRLEEKRRIQHEKLPQFQKRLAGEGEDPKRWSNFQEKYRKRTASNDGDAEQGSDDEENESEEVDEGHMTGKKKIIAIPLHFKPIEFSRGMPRARGGPYRGSGRFHDQPGSNSPNQEQSTVFQAIGEFHYDEQQSNSYRDDFRQSSGRGEFRRVFRNSARRSRGDGRGQYQSNMDRNKIDIHNPLDFPDLSKS